MKAKEKAKTLIDKFYQQTPDILGSEGGMEYAKQMALICTQEVRTSLQRNIGYTQCTIDLEYWNDVAIEINLL